MQRLAQRSAAIASLGRFNFLLSDGEFLIAYGHDRLHYLESPAGADGLVLVTTEPVTAELWQPFARGELRAYKNGTLVLALPSTPGEFGVQSAAGVTTPRWLRPDVPANSAERYDAWYRSPRGEWIANAEFQLLISARHCGKCCASRAPGWCWACSTT